MMSREDWTLLAIAAAKDQGLSPVQLQKSVFLLGCRLPEYVGDDFYHFEPYNYGPFDVAIYQDAEDLERLGLVAIDRGAEARWKTYRASLEGLDLAAQMREQQPARVVRYLDRVVAWVLGLSFRDLVTAIYAEFPEYRANSVFQG